jgi:hypothetical protein
MVQQQQQPQAPPPPPPAPPSSSGLNHSSPYYNFNVINLAAAVSGVSGNAGGPVPVNINSANRPRARRGKFFFNSKKNKYSDFMSKRNDETGSVFRIATPRIGTPFSNSKIHFQTGTQEISREIGSQRFSGKKIFSIYFLYSHRTLVWPFHRID